MQSFKLKSWFSKPTVRFVIAVILAFVAGYIVQGLGSQRGLSDSGQQSVSQKWTCSMHPEIIRDKPGKCPKCGMDLIPMPGDAVGGVGPRELVVSEEAAKPIDTKPTTVHS